MSRIYPRISNIPEVDEEYDSKQSIKKPSTPEAQNKDNLIDISKPTHNRINTIEDIRLVITKQDTYLSYDFLTLRKNVLIIKMLEDYCEDVSSYEMFSDIIYYIDESSKKSKKNLFITSNSINILRPYDISIKVRLDIKKLEKLTISNKNANLIVSHTFLFIQFIQSIYV